MDPGAIKINKVKGEENLWELHSVQTAIAPRFGGAPPQPQQIYYKIGVLLSDNPWPDDFIFKWIYPKDFEEIGRDREDGQKWDTIWFSDLPGVWEKAMSEYF